MCIVWIFEPITIRPTYVRSINCLVFTTQMECVYCAVRTGSLYFSCLEGLHLRIIYTAH
jgi:hypothetical protein